MALPASGQISTGNLETEFAGVTPATKTFANYASMVGGGTSTAIFNSKAKPSVSGVSINLADTAFVLVNGIFSNGGIAAAEFRVLAKRSFDASWTPCEDGWVSTTGSFSHIFFVTYGGTLHNSKIEFRFGVAAAYTFSVTGPNFTTL